MQKSAAEPGGVRKYVTRSQLRHGVLRSRFECSRCYNPLSILRSGRSLNPSAQSFPTNPPAHQSCFHVRFALPGPSRRPC